MPRRGICHRANHSALFYLIPLKLLSLPACRYSSQSPILRQFFPLGKDFFLFLIRYLPCFGTSFVLALFLQN
jgi:hypothetical protein